MPECLPPPHADPSLSPLQIGPECHSDDWLAPAGGAALFSGAQQLFEDGSSVALLENGTLTYSLAPFRHGAVVFRVVLSDGCKFYAANFTMKVLPVATAPSFSLSQSAISVSEDLSVEGGAYLPVAAFATGVGAGGWKEEAQLLRF